MLKSANQLRPLVDENMGRKKSSSGGGKGTNNTNTFSNVSGLGPSQNFTFTPTTPYVPQTSGLALVLFAATGTVSNQGDGVGLAPQINGVGVSNQGQAPALGSVQFQGNTFAITPITKGTPVTPSLYVGNNTIGHTVAVSGGAIQIVVIELQTS